MKRGPSIFAPPRSISVAENGARTSTSTPSASTASSPDLDAVVADRHVALDDVDAPLLVFGRNEEARARIELGSGVQGVGEHRHRRADAECAPGDHPHRRARRLDDRQARLRMVEERRLDLLACARQRHPGLDPVDAGPGSAQLGRRALRVRDPAARRHPVDVARPDRLHRAEAVAVEDLAVEEIRHRREPDVRMRPHVEPLARREARRPHVVEEDERPDHLLRDRRQHAPDGEAADVARVGAEEVLDRGGHGLDCASAARLR